MSKRLSWTIACMLAALFVYPRDSRAGIIEIIAEMSGPRMFGVTADCRLRFENKWDSCKLPSPILARNQTGTKIWLTLGGGFYWSIGKDTDPSTGIRHRAYMVTFDPMLEIESVSPARAKVQVYHGVMGVSYNFLFGDFPKFTNAALKLRPIGIVIPVSKNYGLDLSYDLRLYPSGFTAEDFGKTSATPSERRGEAVHGFTVGIRKKL